MNRQAQAVLHGTMPRISGKVHGINWGRAGILYAGIAVGAAFLSAVASRFGLWDRTLDLKHFANFIAYAAEVNSFLPRAVIPYVAVLATVCETLLGILLILGLWPWWVSLGSAVLLAMFGTAMGISFGLKSPMDYSVFSASGASVLLALDAFRRKKSQVAIERTLNMKGKNRAVAFAILCLGTLSSVNLAAQKQDDAELLHARETVWRAWFAGDTNTLKELVPPETIVMSGGEEQWKHQADVLRTSAEFHARGGKLIQLEFPRTEVQHFGNAAVVWSTYALAIEVDGKRSPDSGRVTEIFVWRDGHWINPGWHTDSGK